ncbi:MAG: 3'-5' exoribonuclease domain-containing protein [Bradymonadia bacterium]
MPIGHDGKTVYFCVDLEASGPVPGIYNMVSVGAVEVRWDGERHQRGETVYIEIVPEFDGFKAEAMAIHGLTVEHLKANGVSAKEAMIQLDAWVKARLQPGERPLFVGHNAPFDWMFVSWYFAWAGMENPFGYNALDTKALTMGKHGLFWKQSNKEKILELYPHLEPPAPEKVHDALADAEFQADILIALLDR